MIWQYAIVGCIVAAAAVWLGYAVYRTFTGKGGGICRLCSKCFSSDCCPTGEEDTGEDGKGQ